MASKVFLVWNSTGLPADRKKLMDGWVKTHKIDVIVLIEGGKTASYDVGGKAVALEAVHEKIEVTARFTLDDTDDFEGQAKTMMGARILAPSGGKSVYKYYAITPGLTALADDAIVSYETNAAVRTWMLAPLKSVIETEGETQKQGRKRRASVAVDKSAREPAIKKTQNRINLLGHRRPKGFEIDGLEVYMWHSPLGGETSTDDLTVDSLPGNGCGGDDAKNCNWLFAKHIGAIGTKAMLVGDLNLDATAVKGIYGSNPAASSSDGWCHAVPGSGVTVKSLAAPDHDKESMGDHAPVIFSATW